MSTRIQTPPDLLETALRHLLKLRRLFSVFVVILTMAGWNGHAAAQNLQLIRDAEIEGLMKEYTSKIFKAAGLGKSYVNVYLVNNPSFNAFVTGRNLFIHTGALMESETPNEIIGVIAHETGHIIGGHQQRMRDQLEAANIYAAVGLLLGAGAIVAGGDLGNAAGSALAIGTGSTIMRSILAYKRDEETSADRAAISLLNKTGQSGKGMLKSFERLGSKMMFASTKADPYIQSHPLPNDRISLLQSSIQASPYFENSDSPSLQLRHDMIRAKIAAYTGGPGEVERLFRDDKTNPAASYGLAISQFLRGQTKDALKIIDRLIGEQPNNAYLHEIKAEILLKARQAKAGIKPAQAAIKLDKYKSGLLRIQYGHLLVETGEKENLPEAIKQLKAGLARDPQTVSGYTYLARAYSLSGDEPRALAASAEQRFLIGDFDDAKRFAIRAQQNLNKNSPEWLRLQDIVLYNGKTKKKR